MDAHDHPFTDDEMHELNQEADFLEQKTTIVPHVNGDTSKPKLQQHDSDPDAQAMVIESLRSQTQDLFSQVSQLNTKLVHSYDRVSDLEDELHVTSSNLRTSTLKISQLELERTQHLSALSTGLLVEKSHVTTELTRLMEKATEEAARRGQAESARAEIEKDLDDLSAGLFGQANMMVAEARLARARSERKVEETEQALKGAEEIVGVLQAQMQTLEAEKERAQRKVEEMRMTVGKGKWVSRGPDTGRAVKLRLLSSHLPYFEFLSFVAHLRSIRPATQQPPAMSTLLPLPFLARLISEDCDPTVRLDLAPSLNWLTRRSVISAIHSGQLTVEPMHTTTLLEELSPPMIPGNSHNTHIACALCGASILDQQSPSTPTRSSPLPLSLNRNGSSQYGSWSSAFLKTSLVQTISTASPANLSNPFSHHSNSLTPSSSEPPVQVYIFRLASTSSSGLPVSLPLSSQQPGGQTRPATIYPLCTSGWCLARLRTTCTLWAFIRTSIVEKVWEEEIFTPPQNMETSKLMNGADKSEDTSSVSSDSKPPVPPRKSRIGALWGSMQRGLNGSREPSEKGSPTQSEDGGKKEAMRPPPRDPARRLPPPPPTHPASHTRTVSSSGSSAALPSPIVKAATAPPPLPKRNRPQPKPASSTDDMSAPTSNGVSEVGATHTDSEPSEPSEQEKPSTDPSLTLAPPPTIVRSDSHEQFTTPDEELPPSSITRSVSPSTIPLPPSAPSTPLQSDFPTHNTQPPVTPPRAATAAVSSQDDKPPSRTSSPVPPPLPRRAAARARPLSVVATPASPTVTEKAPETQEPANTTPEEVVTPKPHEDEVKASEPIVDLPTDDTVEQDSPKEVPADSEGLEKVEEVSVSSDSPEPPKEDRTSLDSSVESSLSEKDRLEDFQDLPDRKSSTPTPEPNGINHEELVTTDLDTKINGVTTNSPEPSEELDLGLYVGDATWEERTWKEVVRLREEMFWARVGGIR